MPSESPQVSPSIAPTRLSSIRLSRVGTPPPNMQSSTSSRQNRAMTAGELHNAMEQEQEVHLPPLMTG